MIDEKIQAYWDNVYNTKSADQMSWTQEIPKMSLDLIQSFHLDKTAKIIDIGGGDSNLVDHLIEAGFENITVLDISAKALENAQKRLGEKAANITWIVSDITEFKPAINYDMWHDRATFHFLTTGEQVGKYLKTVKKHVSGYVVIGTFSDSGPAKCSGLDVKGYNEQTLTEALSDGFDRLDCLTENHITPFGTAQHFLYCNFKRRLF